MQFETDPEFQRLSRAFERAAQEYRVAIEQRKRARAQWENARALRRTTVRRPVGAPASVALPPPASAPAPARPSEGKPARIYMGPILGWVVLRASTPVREADPEPLPDVDAMFDQISMELYWRVKNRYEECKKALDDYVNRRKLQEHRDRARGALGQAANLQMLGLESEADRFIEDAVREVEDASENAWQLYQNSPSPKSRAAVVLLLGALADAQLVGAEGPASQRLEEEANRLLGAGELRQEG